MEYTSSKQTFNYCVISLIDYKACYQPYQLQIEVSVKLSLQTKSENTTNIIFNKSKTF